MPHPLFRLFVACLAVALLATSGCDAIVHSLLEDDEPPPVKNEAGVIAVGKQFGEAILKENYAAAYDLLTNARRAEQSLQQFAAAAREQRQEYFEEVTPTSVETYAYMLFEDELPDWTGLPADVKYESLLGVCTVVWQAEPDLQVGETEAYVNEVDVVVVDEGGQPKIAHIDWADEY